MSTEYDLSYPIKHENLTVQDVYMIQDFINSEILSTEYKELVAKLYRITQVSIRKQSKLLQKEISKHFDQTG